MSQSDDTIHSRKLGEQERLLNYMHPFGGLMPLQVLHVRGPLDTNTLRRGVDWLQQQHPMLRAHIRYGELVCRRLPPFVYRQPYFETRGTSRIPLTIVEGNWESVLHEEMRRPLKRNRAPRLRFTLVRDAADTALNHLILAADHACLDAKVAHLISRDLLEYLADPAAMEARPAMRTSLPPALEDRLPPDADAGTKPYVPALRLPRRPVPNSKRGTRLISRCIEKPAADALRAAVTVNKTSIHGAVTAAFFLAMREVYGIDAMTSMSSVDLRRLCKPRLPDEIFGCYIDVIRTRHDLTSDDFWMVARDVSVKVISAIARDRKASSFLKLPDWEVYAKESWPTMTHRRRLDGLGVTTASDSGLKEAYGDYTLDSVTMAVAVDIVGPSLLVLVAERLGAIDVAICYAEDTLPEADALAITNSAMGFLTNVPAPAAA